MEEISTTGLNLLYSLSKSLTTENEPQKIVQIVSNVLKDYFELKNLDIILFDKQTKTFKDLTKSWVLIDEKTQNEYLENIYRPLAKNKRACFILNNKILDLGITKTGFNQSLKKSIKSKENIVYLPLNNVDEVFGFIQIELTNLKADYDLLLSLKIASYQISSVIINLKLSEKMQKNMQFQKSMKDIAKLIENQYELAYIIPLIGEMIDRFVSEHLIYIFLKNSKGYSLIWPNACNDKIILGMLKQINTKTDYILSPNKKTGAFPLISENTLLGAVVAHSNIDKLIEKDVEYISQLSKQSSTTIQRANVYAEILKHATLDALTGLNNRRQFESRLKQEVQASKRKNKPLCCFMIDVDYFKKVNDTYGHIAGDCILKGLAKVIKTQLREYDIASRYGGEEFAILLPFTNIEEANFVAQRLRKAVEKTSFDISEAKAETKSLNITISVGISSYNPKKDSPQSLYKNADSALYKAKEHGRNKVIIYE